MNIKKCMNIKKRVNIKKVYKYIKNILKTFKKAC